MLLCIAGLKKKDRILAIQALQHVDTILKRVLHDGAATRAALDGNHLCLIFFCCLCLRALVNCSL